MDAQSTTRLDEPAGRGAELPDLRRHLTTAPAPYLEGALTNPGMTSAEMVLLLRNRGAPEAVLRRVALDRDWTRFYEVRRGLTLHPNTPLVVARGLLPHLFWKELAEVAGAPHVNPVLRRDAERILRSRMEELSLGQRVALARSATRGVVASLVTSREELVLRSLLGNVRLVELDVVKTAAATTAPSEFLRFLAGHPRWGYRRAVRLSILGNPRTPVPVALGLLGALDRRDLRHLSRDVRIPRIVRIGAERRLQLPTPSSLSVR